jgi:hypothetical protein
MGSTALVPRRNRTVAVARPRGLRVITAAAHQIDLESKAEAQRQRVLRQSWQLQGWTFYDSIPELGFGVDFLGHMASRMRTFVAAYAMDGKSDEPIAIEDPTLQAPQALIEACQNAIRDLGNGQTSLSSMMERFSINSTVAGEAFLLGIEDPVTRVQTWSIRSIDEIVVFDDRMMLREGPMTNQGLLGLIPLNPDFTTIIRLWREHPRFRLLAQSPMRRLANTLEDLLIMRRIIRATGRSRLAGRGILLIPTELDLPGLEDDNYSGTGDDFVGKLTNAMVTPIRSEGDSSGVVPLVVEGPGDVLDKVRWIDFASAFDKQAAEVRVELVGVIASGLDLPREVVEGVMDANHWTAFMVSTEAFRAHGEPHIITLHEMLSEGYLRPYIATSDLDPDILDAWLHRLTFWYDPTAWVTPTDMSASAKLAHDALVLSDAAFRRYLGFSEEDAPSADEILVRMIRTMRNWPVNAVIAGLHALVPELTFPAISGPGIIPGIKGGPGGGVLMPELPAAPSPTPGPTAPKSAVVPGTEPGAPAIPSPPTPDGGMKDLTVAALKTVLTEQLGLSSWDEVITAAAAPKALSNETSKRLSRKLAAIDADLRARLVTEANAEMRYQLAKAGSRMRQKVAREPKLRNKIAMTKNELVTSTLGKEIVEAAGFTASALMTTDWDTLKEEFLSWVGLAQRQAVAVAARLAGIDELDAHASAAATMSESANAGWKLLKDAMDTLAVHLAYSANPHVGEAEAIAALNPQTLVPTGVVRAALGVAGGSPKEAFMSVLLDNGATVPSVPMTVPVGGVATGATISGILTDAGAQTSGYEWVHGTSEKPFEPHLELDGVEFDSFTDDQLQNTTGFPDNAYFLPGDHAGCSCDTTALWITPGDVDAAQAAADAQGL